MARCLMYFKPEADACHFGISIVHQQRDVIYREDGRWLLYWLLSDGHLPDFNKISVDRWKFRIKIERFLKWQQLS